MLLPPKSLQTGNEAGAAAVPADWFREKETRYIKGLKRQSTEGAPPGVEHDAGGGASTRRRSAGGLSVTVWGRRMAGWGLSGSRRRRTGSNAATVGWSDAGRRACLHRVVCLSRFLVRPGVECRSLACLGRRGPQGGRRFRGALRLPPVFAGDLRRSACGNELSGVQLAWRDSRPGATGPCGNGDAEGMCTRRTGGCASRSRVRRLRRWRSDPVWIGRVGRNRSSAVRRWGMRV